MAPRLLTTATTKTICRHIRAGCMMKVAVVAAGISLGQFYSWMKAGKDPEGEFIYIKFRRDIYEALAYARSIAEKQVFANDPKFWLTNGPNREEWHPYKAGELEMSGRVEVQEPIGSQRCTAPIEHLAEAYLILQELGVFPRTPIEGQQLLEVSGVKTIDIDISKCTLPSGGLNAVEPCTPLSNDVNNIHDCTLHQPPADDMQLRTLTPIVGSVPPSESLGGFPYSPATGLPEPSSGTPSSLLGDKRIVELKSSENRTDSDNGEKEEMKEGEKGEVEKKEKKPKMSRERKVKGDCGKDRPMGSLRRVRKMMKAAGKASVGRVVERNDGGAAGVKRGRGRPKGSSGSSGSKGTISRKPNRMVK